MKMTLGTCNSQRRPLTYNNVRFEIELIRERWCTPYTEGTQNENLA